MERYIMDLQNNRIRNIVFDLGNVVLKTTLAVDLGNMDLTRDRNNSVGVQAPTELFRSD